MVEKAAKAAKAARVNNRAVLLSLEAGAVGGRQPLFIALTQ